MSAYDHEFANDAASLDQVRPVDELDRLRGEVEAAVRAEGGAYAAIDELRKQLDSFTAAVINVSDRPALTALARDIRKRHELGDL